MKKTYLIGLLLIEFFFSGCRNLIPDKDYPLYLINNSPHSVGYYLALGDGYATTVYPDTSLPINNIFKNIIVKSNEKGILYNSHLIWDELFKEYLPADTLSVFIFHTDTLNKYSWEEVRDEYKILNRYDLSLEDLQGMDWTITYP